MRRWRRLAAASTVTLAFAAASPVGAEPPAGPSASPSARSAEREERLRRRVERLLERRAEPSAMPSALAAPSPSGVARLQELSARWAEVAATRSARREQHRAALVRELGARLQAPAVRAELALHSKRAAELGRLEFLAKNARAGQQRDQLLERIEKLRAREASRHERVMAKLASAAAAVMPTPSSSGGSKP